MEEKSQCIGIFTSYSNPGYTREELRNAKFAEWAIADLPGVYELGGAANIVMATQKLAMATLIYPKINNLVITSQTTTPSDSESSYTGTIYTSVDGDEYYRSSGTNPYQVVWNISSSSANGVWGSYICIDQYGAMINRALTGGVSKTPGSNIIVEFTGSVA